MPQGYINVYKPAGMSSHQAVQRIRRITGEKRVGHAGTLDPDAEGILPIAVGQYTRLLEWTRLTPKVYRAAIRLGVMTHTGDKSGLVVGESGGPYPSEDAVRQALSWLSGDVLQFPPQVSALKQNGQRAYAAVRRGQTVWLAPRRIQIGGIAVLEGAADLWRIEATVGSGTYIRALARDMGVLLGQAAMLEYLQRTQVGGFEMGSVWHLDALDRLPDRGQAALRTGTDMLDIPSWPVSAAQSAGIAQGKTDAIPAGIGYTGVVALTCEGTVVAVVDGPPWRYRKVMVKDEG